MSRSYRKPYVTHEKADMRYWNRKLRHKKLEEIPNGCFYKRGVGRWHCKYLWTEQDARDLYRATHQFKYGFTQQFETEEDYINWYKKENICK